MTEILLKAIFTLLQSVENESEELTRKSLELALIDYGFKTNNVNYLLDWISDLSDAPESNNTEISSTGLRVFTSKELDLIDIKFLDYLIKLERTCIINANQRETITEKLQHIDNHDFSLETKQLVISMIIFGGYCFNSINLFEDKLNELQSLGHLN